MKIKYKTSTIILTIHNKDFLLPKSLTAIKEYTYWNYTDIIFVIDGCTDESFSMVHGFCMVNPQIKTTIIESPDVFETKANNIGCKASKADFVIIIQDDWIPAEYAWNNRILEPFRKWGDVFAVSGNCAHNWSVNPNSKGIDSEGWSDVLFHHDHANKTNTNRDTFYIRDCVNRGPLALNRTDLECMGYFDEDAIYLQDSDDHDLCFRMQKKLNKVVGFYAIDFISKSNWGGTRDNEGKMKQWALDCQIKNTQLVFDRHKDIMDRHKIESRNINDEFEWQTDINALNIYLEMGVSTNNAIEAFEKAFPKIDTKRYEAIKKYIEKFEQKYSK